MIAFVAWFVASVHAEDAWIVTQVDALRWPDAAAVTITLEKGDKVEVIVRDAKVARVRKGSDFGWVDLGLLSTLEIEAPLEPLDLGGLPDSLKLPTFPGASP